MAEKKRRFVFKRWSQRVYCNSLGQPFFNFYIFDNGQGRTVDVHSGRIEIWGKWKNHPTALELPTYVIQEAYDNFITMETFILYEVDRDGNERYRENMRYSSVDDLPRFKENVIWALKNAGAKGEVSDE